MGGLFRPEVLTHQERDWLGSIQLIRPVSLSVLTALVGSVVVAVTACLALGEYTRKARVGGYLVLNRGVILNPAVTPSPEARSAV